MWIATTHAKMPRAADLDEACGSLEILQSKLSLLLARLLPYFRRSFGGGRLLVVFLLLAEDRLPSLGKMLGLGQSDADNAHGCCSLVCLNRWLTAGSIVYPRRCSVSRFWRQVIGCRKMETYCYREVNPFRSLLCRDSMIFLPAVPTCITEAPCALVSLSPSAMRRSW